ncbi:MOSC domain-containing protein [Lentzea tibetensis]|uniref:MOSC domain-containing protein n=1 Tax=Lentzea tibetensis TaxID=2591470 RepID=UPI002E272692
MRVVACGRYPVKSLRGEDLPSVSLSARGVLLDRFWALRTPEGRVGSGKTTRRFVRMSSLPDMSAALVGDSPVVTLPSGVSLPLGAELDAAVSAVVDRPVVVAPENDVPHVDDQPIHLVTTASLRWLGVPSPDWMIFRPNLVVDAPGSSRVEDGWIGRRLQVGGALLSIVGPAVRCAMIGAYLREAPKFGVYAQVLRPATVSVGDAVTLSE